MLANCLICGTAFTPRSRGPNNPKAKYCSTRCAGDAKKKPKRVATCRTCGKQYEVKTIQHAGAYCSHKCRNLHDPILPRDCAQCGKSFKPRLRAQRFCSRPCRDDNLSERAGAGQTYVNAKGYLYRSRRGKTWLVHREVMEHVLGRKLLTTEHVHHRNRNPLDNHPDNLVVLTKEEHDLLHAIENALGVGVDFEKVLALVRH